MLSVKGVMSRTLEGKGNRHVWSPSEPLALALVLWAESSVHPCHHQDNRAAGLVAVTPAWGRGGA